jgi:prepilin-type N-terminal cleavage/methylation domain-containing protein
MNPLRFKGRTLGRMRAGFSMVEILFVLIIAGLLVTMGSAQFRKFETWQGIENARNALVLMARRARSSAIEKGANAQLNIDQDAKRAWITIGGNQVDEVLFDQYGVSVANGTGALITVCYGPRGFALTTTCTTAGLPTTVTFARGGQSNSVRVQPLGTIVKS